MYSDRQLNQIRDALRIFKRYEKREDGKSYSWQDVHAAITHLTGYEIGESQKLGAEVIRKFVEGEPRKDGVRHFSKPEWVSYAVEFLTHDDVLVITEDEIEGYHDNLKVAHFLTNYLHGADKYKSGAIPKSGAYTSGKQKMGDFIVSELYLENQVNPFVYEASLIMNYYSSDSDELYEEWTDKEKLDERAAYYLSSGWAVHTPEDELIMVLKTTDGVNKYFSSGTMFKGSEAKELPKEFALVQSKSVSGCREDGTIEKEKFNLNFAANVHDRVSIYSKTVPDKLSYIGE
ncbi:hypothetical protein ND972_13895 [Vibrio diabolicus]|uniref:hypothetical protein n=1 Tax=Vibrio diabolicus TaxID=50719 RepID=UPI00215F5762|nr:hypothetical protein [Vibrio diabolicus]MCS0397889.1 hypothetical protein [Vibrio diabolicus]